MVGEGSSTENLEDTPGAVAQRLHDERLTQELQDEIHRTEDKEIDQDNDFGDPQTPPGDASSEQKLAYSRALNEYSKEILEHLPAIPDIRGEQLWIELTCSCRKQTLNAMSSTLQIDQSRFLRTRGVEVSHKRGNSRWKALQNCLEAESFLPAAGSMDDASHFSTVDERNEIRKRQTMHFVEKPTDSGKQTVSNAQSQDQEGVVESNKIRFRERTQDSSQASHGLSRRGPVESLMKAYQNQTKYSGSFVEDFEGAVEQFNTICGILEFSAEEKAKGFPVMLRGAAFAHYSRQYSNKNLTYHDLVDAFRGWYTSEEQKKRLLNIWQTPSLTRELQASPENSELEVFQKPANKLVAVQNQLHSDYHEDRFLRDQLIRAADIAHLQHSLNDKVPNTAQEAMHRIANRLSAEPRSAGANFAGDSEDLVNYGLGMKFGGKAQKHLKGTNTRSSRKKLSRLLASAKGCYVCGGAHRARQAHNPKEIIEAIERIKRENPSVLFSIDDVIDIQYALAVIQSEDGESDQNTESDEECEADRVNWVSLNPDDEHCRKVHDHLANVAFVHGRTFASDLKTEMESIEAALAVGESSRFNGIVLDTGANRSSVMSLDQYKATVANLKFRCVSTKVTRKTLWA